MRAKIFQPAQNAMQSGKAGSNQWVLAMEKETARRLDPLMGYTIAEDMASQIHISFDTQKQAIDFAKKAGISFVVQAPQTMKRRHKSYADNFSADRKQPWTH